MRVNRVDRVPPSMPINTIPLLQEGVRGRPRLPPLPSQMRHPQQRRLQRGKTHERPYAASRSSYVAAKFIS